MVGKELKYVQSLEPYIPAQQQYYHYGVGTSNQAVVVGMKICPFYRIARCMAAFQGLNICMSMGMQSVPEQTVR